MLIMEHGTFATVAPRWEILIVDEGHRVKNDTGLFFNNINQLDTGFKVLMTGTPLQNNLRELFSLLNLLDKEKFPDGEEFLNEYQNEEGQLIKEKIPELHELLKRVMLRRVKTDVLDNLPSKTETIVPVSLSKTQRQLYRAILAGNFELLKAAGNRGKGNTR
ncbi:hypothetical protein HDU93_006362, partial [Gonapodya sp. JEL0774]